MKFPKGGEYYSETWPPKAYHTWPGYVTQEQVKQFARLVDKQAHETTIDAFLRNNKEVLSTVLWFARTGHHGAWVVPQQEIRRPQARGVHGLKPDYIVGGKNSDGFTWAVVELKGVNARLFAARGGRLQLSSTANQGLCQIIEYVEYATHMQSYLRESLRLTDFREPLGVLMIGREDEFRDTHRQRLKAALNRYFGNRIQIRTYDALLRDVRSMCEFHHQGGGNQTSSTVTDDA